MEKYPGANCLECPLAKGMYYEQPTAATHRKYLFIGSGPTTANEGFHGGFLHGTDAGSLLRKVCHFQAIPVDDVAYTTSVRCTGMSDLSLRDKKKAVSCCNNGLFDVIDRVDPVAVVTLGTEAALAVGQTAGVVAARQGPPKFSEATQTPVVHTVSPWACLNTENQFQFLVTDVGKLVHPAPVFEEPIYKVVTDESTALATLDGWLFSDIGMCAECTDNDEDYCIHRGMKHSVVLDIEVGMEKDISFEHPERYDMLCIGVSFDNSKVFVFAEGALTKEFYNRLGELCFYSEVVAHNGKFDLAGLRPLCGKIDLNFDTMLASYVFDERTGVHGLKYLAQEYLGAPPYDNELDEFVSKTKKDFTKIPKDLLYRYNAYDIHCTRLLYEMYKVKFKGSPKLHDTFKMLINASNMLQNVEHSGMAIDEGYLNELDETMQIWLKESLSLVSRLVVDSIGPLDPKLGYNPNSPMQTKKFLELSGISVPNTAKDTLTEVVSRIDEIGPEAPESLLVAKDVIQELAKYKEEKKLHGTYISGTKERLYKGRVHPTYLIHGTTTGRLSARNPNTQNISSRPEIKRLFVSSEPGRSIVHADYSQAELRILSFLAEDKFFRNVFLDPSRDLFDELIVEIFPKAVKGSTEEELFEWKMKRRIIKTIVYGLNYGRTKYGVANGLKIEVEEADSILQKFFSTIPEIVQFQEWVKNEVREGRDLVTPFGRHRRYSLITRQNEKKVMNEALAFLPQSTASDCTLVSAIRINSMFDLEWSSKDRPRIINLVHDDIIAECDDADIDDVEKIIANTMVEVAESVVSGYVPFAVDAGHAKDWGSLH